MPSIPVANCAEPEPFPTNPQQQMTSMQLTHRYGVVVYGARDHYQVQLALHEVGALERVFTDLYAPHWMISLAKQVAPLVERRLRMRHHPELKARYFSGDYLRLQVLFRYLNWRGYPIAQQNEIADDRCAKRAARYVLRHPDMGLVCYSYYWREVAALRAAGHWNGPAVVFQVHPAPSQVKSIISRDRNLTGLSYLPEPEELSKPKTDGEYIASFTYASGIIAASSFTAHGLVDWGIPAGKIRVVPYGLAGEQTPDLSMQSGRRGIEQRPLRLLWVGQLAYRKAPHHLFEAVRRFPPDQVELNIVSRSAVPSELRALIPPNVRILDQITNDERRAMYRSHHLFVLPSLVEGFGLVYAEALAEGLPILATPNSGAPDIITPGIEGFIVAPGSADTIAEAIELCLKDPSLLPAMSRAARIAASQWTWEQFRSGIRNSLAAFEQASLM